MKKDSDNYEDEENETQLLWKRVRLRNLKINLAKKMIEFEIIDRDRFTQDELKNKFAFKEYDIKYLAAMLFDTVDNEYCFKEDTKSFIGKVIQSNKIAQSCLPSAEASFLRIYGSFHEETEKHLYRDLSWGKFQEINKKIKDILPIIHWGRLPIFDKNLLFNRELDPETQTLEFYDHPDCLRTLLYDIRNQGIVLSNDSDQTLNRDMYFDVYTRRWGHNDRYIVTRTVDGWYCKHLAINGRCEKDGNGGLFANLRHDSVFFPQEGVEHALCELWEAADDGEIDFAELSKRLQEVADWISVVEKAIYAQPKWVNYY